jgi:hypothetical protein
MAGLFIQWLYFDAPRAYLGYAKGITVALYNFFSLPLLMSTLFSPWRHDSVPLANLPMQYWAQAIGNNVVSRFIGFSVRFFTIILGLATLFLITLGTICFYALWYALPLLLLGSLYYGFMLTLGGSNA